MFFFSIDISPSAELQFFSIDVPYMMTVLLLKNEQMYNYSLV